MKLPQEVRLVAKLYELALELRNESERMLFLAVFAAAGTIGSVGAGLLVQLIRPGPFVFVIATIVSSTILIPLSLLLGVNLWDKLRKSRALSGDEFAYSKYLKDEYDQDVRDIKALPISEAEKKGLIKNRYAKYVEEREEIQKSIGERIARRKDFFHRTGSNLFGGRGLEIAFIRY